MSVRTGVWFFPDVPGPKIVETIVAAEALGLGEVWLGDEGPARDPFALLAAAALPTRRVRLGVAVTNPYLRHPATTAASALTVHELSGGRMVLGIGPGGDLSLKPAQVERTRPLAATRRAVRIIRAVSRGEPTEGYTPAPHALVAPDLPVFVGARGEAFNRFASEAADGAFLAGIPNSRLAATAAWARSTRAIDLAVYASAVFDDASREAVRPRLIYALLDAPEATRHALGVSRAAAARAAQAIASGDDRLARQIVDDRVLEELLVYGQPAAVGRALAARWRALHPQSVGIALLAEDPLAALEPAAEALATVAREIACP
ncbi:MAG TPA: LLM class flavin-dependent oxidoreductase [Chloroflexota bacterium]|nr:LLM class flavin-dependent oxidoreductase [Chloroflexota bacterium]